jgi:hypothetical protein
VQHLGDEIFYLENFFSQHKNLKEKVEIECNRVAFLDYENNEIPYGVMNKSGYFLIKKESPLHDLILELNFKIQLEIEIILNKKLISQWQNTEHVGVIGRYPTGGSLPDHADKVHLQDEYYYYSSVYYLNNNYKGGKLFFPEKNISVEPKENSVVFLPSHFIHRSEEIISGEKIVSPTFFKEIKNAN